MGNTSSVPERIYKAAKANDVNELQGLCRDMRLNGALDIATKRRWLNWTDPEGRTALHWAAQRNYLQVVQILLEEGADVHIIAPKRPNGGSALAEAVAGKHEAVVELLLRYGADPFTENPGGKTPFDQALELRAVNISRSFERYALFAGYVNMKVLQLKGFSHAAKDRWVVVAPRYTPPSQRSGGVGVVRVMMLVYRNAAEAEPRTKVWLDGATIFRAGQEAVLRLHPNHEQPRNAFTKYDQGWMLFFKQAQTSFSSPIAAAAAAVAGPTLPGGVNSHSLAAGAAATFAAFMAVCYRPLDHLHAQQQLRATGASVGAAAGDAYGSSGAAVVPAPNPWQQQQQQQPSPRPALPSSVASGSPGYNGSSVGSPLTASRPQQQQQQQPQYHYAGLHLQPAGAPPAAAQAGSAGAGRDQRPATEASIWQAAPGESDEDFARRLASSFGSNSPNSRTMRAQQQQQAAAAAAGSGGPYPSPYPSLNAGVAGAGRTGGSDSSASSGSSTPSAPPAAAAAGGAAAVLPLSADNPFRANDNPFRTFGNSGAATATATSTPLQAGDVAGAATVAAAQPVSRPVPASAPAAAAAAAAAAPSAPLDGGADGECCVICLSSPREVGFLHGASVHKCVCKECAALVHVGSPCPMCRQSIERVIGVY